MDFSLYIQSGSGNDRVSDTADKEFNLKLKFWGVSGSIPSPCTSAQIRGKMKHLLSKATPADLADEASIEAFLSRQPHSSIGTYKGSTSCVQVSTDYGHELIFDAGTGIRSLAGELLRGPCGKGQGELHLFLSHLHWDHIQGFPFFVPAYIPGNRINIYGVIQELEKKFRNQMIHPYFPVLFEHLAASFVFTELEERKPIQLGENVVVHNERLYHPQVTHAFSVTQINGKKVVYMTDSEFNLSNMQLIQDAVEICKDADAFIFDCQFTFADCISKMDWGHSSVFTGIDIATSANAKELFLFHHEPSYDDSKIDQIIEEAIKYRAVAGNRDLKLTGAYEGLEVQI